MPKFTYTELPKALADLHLFSSMNANENRPLYMINVEAGLQITQDVDAAPVKDINSIGVNGKVFTYSEPLLTPSQRLQATYQHFTLDEWKAIARSVSMNQELSETEKFTILTGLPSAAL